MHVLITVNHPWSQSFNFAIAQRITETLIANGHTVDLLDLDRENFDPVMHVEELRIYNQGRFLDPQVGLYQQRIQRADHLVYLFPVWWEVMPALLKGFFDKVFLPGFAFAEADAAPLLTHIQTGTAITTMGAPRPIYTSVEPVLLKGILEFCGVQRTRWFNLADIPNTTPEQRTAWVDEIIEHFRTL